MGVYDQDREVIYLRNTEYIKVTEGDVYKQLSNIQGQLPCSGYSQLLMRIIGFCGKIYKGFWHMDSVHDTQYIYDMNIVLQLIEQIYTKEKNIIFIPNKR